MEPVAFGLLGPLEVRAGDRPLPLAGPKRRALLGLLLLHGNEVISTDRIINALWGEDAPASARTQVQSLVHAVRQHLAGWHGATIETRAPGYVLAVDPDQVDVSAFECRAAEARGAAADGRLEEAAETFRTALDLWRGPALDGLQAPFVPAEAARLEERRLLVLEECLEADLALGRHALLVAELKRLVAEHPLRERLRAALMLALHRSGRQAEALEVYRLGRSELVESTGLEPGRELRDLERAILHDEPSLHLGSPPAVAAAPAPAVPSRRPGRRRLALPRGRRLRVAAAVLLTLLSASAAIAGLRPGGLLAPVSPRRNALPLAFCRVEAGAVTDYLGRVFNSVSHCRQLVGSALYANPEDKAPLAEVSFRTASADVAVVCQMKGRPNPVLPGRAGSNYWIYAKGDTVTRANPYGYLDSWAFLPADVLAQDGGDRPVPGVPTCQLNVAVPGIPGVASPDYPADGDWHGRPGQPARFRFSPVAGTADLAGFLYSFDIPSADIFVASAGPLEVRLTPPTSGPHTLFVRARDETGNVSQWRAFAFEVGPRPADVAAALAAAPPGCASGALCVYSGWNYTGTLSILHDCNRSWATFARADIDESWYNNGPPGRYARIWQRPDFTGLSYALAPGTGVTGGLHGSDAVVDRGNSNDWPATPDGPSPPLADCPD